MKENNRFYGSLVLTLVFAFLTLIAAYLGADFPLIWQISSGVTAAAFLAHLAMNAKVYGDIFSKRTTKYGLKSVFNAILVFAIIVVVNMIVANYDWKIDVTKNKIHTLSDQ